MPSNRGCSVNDIGSYAQCLRNCDLNNFYYFYSAILQSFLFYLFIFRHYHRNESLPIRLQPESMEKLYCLRACVIRSLYHTYRPFVSRIARNPVIPEITPSSLKNSKVSVGWSVEKKGHGFYLMVTLFLVRQKACLLSQIFGLHLC